MNKACPRYHCSYPTELREMGRQVPFPILFGGKCGDWPDDLAQQRAGRGHVVNVQRRMAGSASFADSTPVETKRFNSASRGSVFGAGVVRLLA